MALQQRLYLLIMLTFAVLDVLAQQRSSPDFQLGKALYEQGYYDSACFYLQKSYLAGDSLNDEVLMLYAEALSQAGKFPVATVVIGKLKQMADEKQDMYRQAKALALMGDVHLKSGQVQLAEDVYRQALQTYSPSSPDTVTASLMLRLGLALFSMGQYNEAKKYAGQCHQILSSLVPPHHQDWAGYYKLAGAIYDRQANYDSAMYYYDRSLAIQKMVHGEHHPETAKLWVNLANLYHVRGANIKAHRYFNRALETMQEFLGKDHIIVAIIYNNMAIIDFDMGNFEKAIIYYQHALNTYRQKMGSQSLQVAQIQNNIASAYLEMEEAQKSLEYAFQSLKIREQQLDTNNILFAPVYVNLAGAYILQHDFARANHYSNRAIQIYAGHGETLHPGMAESYTGLGESYLAQNQPEQALSFFYKAREVSLHLYSAHHTKLAFINNLIGNAFRQLHQSDSAIYYYEQAIQAALPSSSPGKLNVLPKADRHVAQHFLMDALKGKAEALYLQYLEHPQRDTAFLHSAYEIYNHLSEFIDEMRNSYQREESKLFLSGIARPVYARGLDVAWDLYQITGDIQYAKQSFSFSEKSKYVLLSDFLNDITAKYASGIPEEVLEKEFNMKSQIAYLEKQIFEAPYDSVKALYEPQLAELKKGYLDFTYQLEKEYPEYYQLKYNTTTATVDQLQRMLEPDEQLVEYALTDSALYVFSIHTDTLNFYKTEIREPLETMVMQMRQGLLDRNFSAYTENAWKLYNLLAAGWKESHKQIIIIPDGVLDYVPFEVLLTKKVMGSTSNYWQLPYLLKDYVISYHYSATLYLAELNKKEYNAYQSFMVGFAPEFTSDTDLLANVDTTKVERNTGLLKLNGAQQELRKIAELFQGKFFFGADATEANFKHAVLHSRVIHLGTHGILDDENPAMSYLVFTSGKDSLEDNLLHTYEIYNLKLNAELVTLSACNTGTGQLREGEGVMSLARGFAYAGCPNVVTSLWPASDYATAQLMQRFYYYLSNGWSKNKALHQAKLDFLADADENLSNPYYWGSFILVGDVEPLHMERYSWIIWYLATGGVLIMGWLFYLFMLYFRPGVFQRDGLVEN